MGNTHPGRDGRDALSLKLVTNFHRELAGGHNARVLPVQNEPLRGLSPHRGVEPGREVVRHANQGIVPGSALRRIKESVSLS